MRAALALLAGLHAAVFGYVVWRTSIRAPFADMVSWLGTYLQFRADGGVAAYLFAFHNEHRLAWIRLLTALDARAFHSSGVPFIVAATGSLLIAAWLATRELARAAGWGGLTLLAPMLFLLTANAVDCSIPINAVYPIALVFVVAGVVLFDGAEAGGSSRTPRRVAAILLIGAAGFANAVGLAAWPVLLFAAWRGGAGWRWLAAIAVVAAAYDALYVHGMPSAEPGGPADAGKMALYLLSYLGLPLSRAAALAIPSRILGGALLLAGGLAVVRFGLLARPTRLQRIAAALILFALIAAVLAAIGRAGLDPDINAPLRYTVLLAPLHAGLLCLILPPLLRRAGKAARVAGLALAVALLAMQVAGGRAAIVASDGMAAVVARYYAGERSAEVAKVMFPDLAVADDVLAKLRAAGLAPD